MAESRVIRDRIASHLIQASAWMRNLAALEGDSAHLDAAVAVDRIADAYRRPLGSPGEYDAGDDRER